MVRVGGLPTDIAAVAIGALAVLIGLAGAAKTRRPEPAREALRAAGIPAAGIVVRVVAGGELLVAAAGLGLPGWTGGLIVAATFAALTAAAAIGGGRAGALACGCFGDADGPALGPRHVATNALAAFAAAAGALAAPRSIAGLAGPDPAAAVVRLSAAVAVALALRAWLRGGGPRTLESSALRLVDSTARALESRFSRRSALIRLAVGGSALTIAPLRYLLYPGDALAVVAPGSCAGGVCTDGYTAFCCEINQGLNGCPTGTFIGGWWMCTDYHGRQLCHGAGVRYYIDCNALPGRPFPGGCRCADDSCDKRAQNCNVFRYGQCNTQIKGTTPVVCRVISCENPGTNPELNCGTSLMVDDATCTHEAPCLEPPAIQLAGSGGA